MLLFRKVILYCGWKGLRKTLKVTGWSELMYFIKEAWIEVQFKEYSHISVLAYAYPNWWQNCFRSVRKAAKSDCWLRCVCLSVCPSVRPSVPPSAFPSAWKHLGFHWTDFYESLFSSIFWKSVKKSQISLKSVINNGYITWKCMYISDTSLNSS